VNVESISGIVGTVALGLALAACAGLRAWLPLFLAGALSRAGFLALGPSYGFLGSNRALILFGVASLIEIVADKVPAVDHALDILSTVLRPAAGALLAAAVFGKITEPGLSLVLGIVLGAPTALVPHAGKSSLRALSTLTTAGIGNPFLSTLEDFGTVALFAVAIVAPFVVVGLILLALALIVKRASKRPPQAVQPG
jgi:hypothetical protein